MKVDEIARCIAAVGNGTVKRDGASGYFVTCPTHFDSEPSVHVSSGRCQSVVVKCHGGCPTETILRAAGLTWQSLCAAGTRASIEIDCEYVYANQNVGRLFTGWRSGHGKGKRFGCYRFD